MKLIVTYNRDEIISNVDGKLELNVKFYSPFDNKLRLATENNGKLLKRKDLFVGLKGGISIET